jgi:hypothetical protein
MTETAGDIERGNLTHPADVGRSIHCLQKNPYVH